MFLNDFSQTKYTNFTEFNHIMDKKLADKYNHDPAVIHVSTKTLDLNATNELKSGVYDLLYKKVKFQLFINNKKSKKLYIFLNAGGNRIDSIKPTFQRWSYYKFIDGTMINIADPMYTTEFGKALATGWYYGDTNTFYLNYVCEIVSTIIKNCNYQKNNVYFVGSSAGGYAALYCSCKISGSNAIAINSQIKLSFLEGDFLKLRQALHVDSLDSCNIDSRNDIRDLIINNTESKLLLLENYRSQMDMDQLEYLCKKLNVSFNYGIHELQKNLILWLYDANLEPCHNAQETRIVFLTAVKLLTETDYQNLDDQYLYYTEFWRENFYLRRDVKNLRAANDLNQSIDVILLSNDYLNINYKTKLLCEEKFSATKGNSIYTSKLIDEKLKPNTSYLLQWKTSSLSDTNVKAFTITIRNYKTNQTLLQKEFNVNKQYCLLFRTKNNTENLQLRLSPGIIGHCDNKSLTLNDFSYGIL